MIVRDVESSNFEPRVKQFGQTVDLFRRSLYQGDDFGGVADTQEQKSNDAYKDNGALGTRFGYH